MEIMSQAGRPVVPVECTLTGLLRCARNDIGNARVSRRLAATARPRRFAPALILALWLLEAFSRVAAAHEGEVHLTEGFALSPLALVVLGGLLFAILLAGFLLWLWASRSLRRKQNKLNDTGPQGQ